MSPNIDPAHTELIAHLNTQITPGQNLVYCATFQLVWNQLADEIIRAPIALDGNPLTAQALNKRQFEKNELAEASYLAMVGFGYDDIVEKIKRGLKQKFNREPGLLLMAEANDILSYAYLEKNLPFDIVFDVFDEPLVFNNAAQVQSFGIREDGQSILQVVVLDYTSSDDFIIKLQASPKVDKELEAGANIQRPRITDDVILAKVTPMSTLAETVEAVFGRIDEEKYKQVAKGPFTEESEEKRRLLAPWLDPIAKEILQIPKLNFNIQHNFTELEGRFLQNENFEHYRVAQAIQAVKFQLDETGAQLSSEALMGLSFGVHIPEPDPRKFIFDKPFLFCLREKGASHPYLVVWVENADLLVKAL